MQNGMEYPPVGLVWGAQERLVRSGYRCSLNRMIPYFLFEVMELEWNTYREGRLFEHEFYSMLQWCSLNRKIPLFFNIEVMELEWDTYRDEDIWI